MHFSPFATGISISPSPTTGHVRAETRTERRTALLLTLLFACVAALGIAHHEMWRDELQAWMIARDSASVGELIRNLRYEGHPAAWHLLLFGLSRFSRDPVAMQGLHLLVATGVVFVLARFSPFSWRDKALIAFGYFFLYEYALISRGYALGVLALFGFLALYPQRKRSPIPLAAMLFVLANTSAYGLIIAMALGVVLLAEWVVEYRAFLSGGGWNARMTAGVALAASGMAVSLAQIIPRSDASFTGVALSPDQLGTRAARAMSRVWSAYVPIPDVLSPHWWNTNLLHTSISLAALSVVLSVLIVAAIAAMFASRPFVLFLFVLGTGGILAFTFGIYPGSLRHHGHLFVLFIACQWLARLPASPGKRHVLVRPFRGLHFDAPWARGLTTAVLLVHLAVAVFAYTQNLRRPFSVAGEAAAFLRETGLDRLPIAGSTAPPVSAVSGMLDTPIHYLDSGTTGTFLRWNQPGVTAADESAAIRRLGPFLDSVGPDAVAILTFCWERWEVASTEPKWHVSHRGSKARRGSTSTGSGGCRRERWWSPPGPAEPVRRTTISAWAIRPNRRAWALQHRAGTTAPK